MTECGSKELRNWQRTKVKHNTQFVHKYSGNETSKVLIKVTDTLLFKLNLPFFFRDLNNQDLS